MASKAKKSAKPSKRDLRKLADAQLTRKLDKTKRALAKEKDRAKTAAKKAKTDIAKAAGKQADSAKAVTKKIKKSGRKSVAEVVAAVAATVPAAESAAARKRAVRKPAVRKPAARRVAVPSGSAKPDASWTIAALRTRAREAGITGYSRLSKAALLERLK